MPPTIQRALEQPLLNLAGLYCNIGSVVTDASLYGEAFDRWSH
jgi:hypothetical protein